MSAAVPGLHSIRQQTELECPPSSVIVAAQRQPWLTWL